MPATPAGTRPDAPPAVAPTAPARPQLHVTSPGRRGASVAANLALLLVGAAFLVPLAWIVLASLDADATVSVALPEAPTLQNFRDVLTYDLTLLPLWNSLVVSGGAALVTVVVATLAAYPLSRYRMRFNRSFLYAILFGSCLPITAIMVPVYALFVALGMLDSLIGTVLFLAATSLPMAVWMLKNFMDGVPVSLEEAAWVDGASAMTALRRIVVPLMRPGLAVVFIFVFTQAWGNFFVPFVLLLDPARQPAAVSIYTFFGTNGAVAYGQLAAFSILYATPVLALYLVVQRLAGGSFALAGSVKG
ncbi:carbohydrate ABC transporter permease [Kineococcus indalonis]|uniref:carbohydrate ABC transporter permease n=1 Tax=Kineococcus indalonis TaxID=2696566 RepID=UPI0014123679|nr:carbohydrate ABC transporter permease [Kineococcus indalonis]NAZ87612.1 ABC transporter permease subunit [Kineococcus indalonis]